MTALYIGPGIGVGTLILVIIVLSIVALSLTVILWGFIKKIFRKVKALFTKK
jgi:hypothetical protein